MQKGRYNPTVFGIMPIAIPSIKGREYRQPALYKRRSYYSACKMLKIFNKHKITYNL